MRPPRAVTCTSPATTPGRSDQAYDPLAPPWPSSSTPSSSSSSFGGCKRYAAPIASLPLNGPTGMPSNTSWASSVSSASMEVKSPLRTPWLSRAMYLRNSAAPLPGAATGVVMTSSSVAIGGSWGRSTCGAVMGRILLPGRIPSRVHPWRVRRRHHCRCQGCDDSASSVREWVMSEQSSPGNRPARGQEATGWAVGFILFAAIMMIMAGVFQALAGLVAIFENEFYVPTRNYLFQFDATSWGWIHLLVGLLVAFAGWGLLSGRTWARAVAITLAVLSAIANFAFIPYYPFWSMLIIVIDIVVIWAVAVYGGTLRDTGA